jgi:plastocyanin
VRIPQLLVALFSLVACLAFGAPSGTTLAQDAPPVTVASGGLVNPRGFAFDVSGRLIVAERGTGGETTGSLPLEPPTGPIAGGPSGGVSLVTDACPAPIATGLPSARNALGDTFGPSAVAVIGERMFALVSGGGDENGNPGQASGVYEIGGEAPVLLADLGAWYTENDVRADPAVVGGGNWIAMIATPAADALLIVESSAGYVLRVDLAGPIDVVADLTDLNAAPFSIAVGPDGAIYVGLMTEEPYTTGGASVVRLGEGSEAETVWSGLTLVTGVAVDPSGVLYASQLSDVRDRAPFLTPGTGSIVRQTGPESSETVVNLLNLPGALGFGPDGGLYVSLPTIGSDAGTGTVLRIDTAATIPIETQNLNLAPPSCLAGTEEVVIVVDDLGINPSNVTILPGTTVTWRIGGEFDHAVASDPASPLAWDSGVMRPGQTFSVTFTEPGVYVYFDGLYPDRTAEIVVVGE